MHFCTRFAVILCVFVSYSFCHHSEIVNKLLVVLVDGCRSDYITPELTGFARIAKTGVRAEYVKPIYPSNSYPNWYTLVTGLYAENHGFIQNKMYDEENNRFFLMVPDPARNHPDWWNQAEPIWIGSERQDVHSSLYWWDGCQVEIRARRPTKCLEYKDPADWNNITDDYWLRFKEILDTFQKGQIGLALVYYEPVDFTGHYTGPESDDRKKALRDIDQLLGRLQDEIYNRRMQNEMTLMVVSDHGMTDTEPRLMKHISLDKYAPDIRYILDHGSLSLIWPQTGKLDKLYGDLKRDRIEGLRVYLKDEIPEKYHWKRNRLMAPLVLQAQKGYFIEDLHEPEKTKRKGPRKTYLGFHGYDPDEVTDMRTIFYATGRGIVRDYVSPPLENVDHYNMMCHLIGIKPQPNNGSWDRIKGMLTDGQDATKGSLALLLSCLLSTILSASLFSLKD